MPCAQCSLGPSSSFLPGPQMSPHQTFTSSTPSEQKLQGSGIGILVPRQAGTRQSGLGNNLAEGSCSHQSEGSEKRDLGTSLSRQTGRELWRVSSMFRPLSFSPGSLTAQVIWFLGEGRVTRRTHGLSFSLILTLGCGQGP